MPRYRILLPTGAKSTEEKKFCRYPLSFDDHAKNGKEQQGMRMENISSTFWHASKEGVERIDLIEMAQKSK